MGSKNDNVKNALCYIPLVAIVLFFVEQKKSKELVKHINYWIILFFAYLIINYFLHFLFGWIIFLVYVLISAYLWYKAYNGEEVQVEYIDKLEDKIKDSINNNKKTKK